MTLKEEQARQRLVNNAVKIRRITMKVFRIKYQDGSMIYAKANKSIDIIRQFDLCTRANIKTRVSELQGEQAGIAMEWLEDVQFVKFEAVTA